MHTKASNVRFAPAQPEPEPVPLPEASPHSWIVDLLGPLLVWLLLYIGFFKAAPFMRWAPVDLTVLCLAMLVIALGVKFVAAGGRVRIARTAALLVAACAPAALYVASNPAVVDKRIRLVIPLVAAIGAVAFVRSRRSQSVWLALHVLLGIAIVTTAVGLDVDATMRFEGAGSNTIGAGRASGVAIVVLLIFATSVGFRYVWAALAAVGLAGWLTLTLISTGSRGPAFACVAAVLIVALCSTQRGRILRIVAAAGATLAGWLVLAGATGLGATRITESLTGRENLTEARSGLWSRALTEIPSHPLGVGWGNFWALLSPSERLQSGYNQYPHNVVLEVFVEAGWIAGFLTVVFIILSLDRLRRGAHDTRGAALLGIAVFFLINAMVSGDVNDNRMMWAALAIGWVGCCARVPDTAALGVAVPTRRWSPISRPSTSEADPP